MINIKSKGDFGNTIRFLKKASNHSEITALFSKYGEQGVTALQNATPVDSGKTARSWYYEILDERGSVTLTFYNSNVNQNVNVAILIQYGHGTRNGAWINGTDYINPALKPIFDAILQAIQREVVNN